MDYTNYEHQQEVLQSKFDVEVHKKTFVNYLEVIIDEEGIVHYAVPSHLEYLLKMFMNKNKCCDRNYAMQQVEKLSIEKTETPIDFLIAEMKAVSVWYRGYWGKPNEKQKETLKKLKEAGVYGGNI